MAWNLGFLSSIQIRNFFRVNVTGGSGNDYGEDVAIDTDFNSYAIARAESFGAGGADFYLIKYAYNGEVVWERTLGGANTDYGYGVAVDSARNVYICGYTESTPNTSKNMFIAKYDPNGTVLWQRTLSGGSDDIAETVRIDSSGNIYLVGSTASEGSRVGAIVAKYNSSGVLQWKKLLITTEQRTDFRDLDFDSSGNLLIAGRYLGGKIYIVKMNSSGTIIWQRTLSSSGHFADGHSIAVDSNDDVYVGGYTSGFIAGSTRNAVLAKISSSGSLLWQRLIGDGDGAQIIFGLDIDLNNNVYGSGQAVYNGTDSFGFVKYNSSGTLQFQRSLVIGPFSSRSYGLVVDREENILLSGFSLASGNGGGGRDSALAVLPKDGSRTGSYVNNIVYSASNWTTPTLSLIFETGDLTVSNSGLSDSASNLTEGTPTSTNTIRRL